MSLEATHQQEAATPSPRPLARLCPCPLITPAPHIVRHWQVIFGNRYSPADIQNTALHEAGHAVVSRLLNRLEHVTILCDDKANALGQTTLKYSPRWKAHGYRIPMRVTKRERALTTFGGPVADMLSGRAPAGWMSDMECLYWLLGDDVESLRGPQIEVSHLLVKNWRGVLAVANRLLERGFLTQRQVTWAMKNAEGLLVRAFRAGAVDVSKAEKRT